MKAHDEVLVSDPSTVRCAAKVATHSATESTQADRISWRNKLRIAMPGMSLKKTMAGLVTALVLGAVSAPSANADCDGYGCTGKVTRLFVRAERGVISIATDGDETDLDNCKPKEGVYIQLNPSRSGSDNVYKLLLSAMLADRDVFIRTRNTSDDEGECELQYVTLSR